MRLIYIIRGCTRPSVEAKISTYIRHPYCIRWNSLNGVVSIHTSFPNAISIEIIQYLRCSSRVVYCELIHSNKLYMRDVTVINSTWLQELASNFYHIAPDAV